ncbi:hypothetical protein [Planctomycetes bacterium TBK1r]|uniref:Sulfotransferase family protein n=1 Tax=Stieleria magnilauensis TaxID=2527963 RepID=A0ABX5XM53_9BACT|nr:hypothetical protein TBK1r_18480 [Planctomycetes bacterium TBK1r]
MNGQEFPRLVFCVTTGRSGTGLLTRQMSRFQGVYSAHEEEPNFVDVMRCSQSDPRKAKEFLIESKLPSIKWTKSSLYFDSSHLFCKGFFEPLVDLGLFPDLIILRRDMRSVAKSLLALGTIPSRSSLGRRYLLQPDDPGVLALGNWEHLSDYQLCYWYCVETERRACLYRKKAQDLGSKVVEIEFEALTSGRSERMLERELGLVPSPCYRVGKRFFRRSKKVNAKSRHKIQLGDLDFAGQEAEVNARLIQDNCATAVNELKIGGSI